MRLLGKKEQPQPEKQETTNSYELSRLEPVARPHAPDPVLAPVGGPSLNVPPPKHAPMPTPTTPARDVYQAAAAVVSRSNVAFLDQGARIKGNLQFDCPIQIDGQIEGEITGKQSIMIGENARVVATIRAASVVIEGTVNGDIIATERVELRPKAHVLGNLTAPTLIIQEGAQYEGRCSMNLQPEVRPVAAERTQPQQQQPQSITPAPEKSDPWK